MFDSMSSDGMWGGHGAMWGMGVGWILVVALLVLGVAALLKFLVSGRGR